MTAGAVIPFPRRSAVRSAGLWPSTLALIDDAAPSETERAYESDWRLWCAWLARHGAAPGDAADHDLANYLAGLVYRGAALATVRRRAAGIEAGYKRLGLPRLAGPGAREILQAAALRLGDNPRRARPLLPEQLRAVIDGIDARLPAGARDEALLLLGWQAALRQSELARLNWSDWDADAPLVVLRETKAARDGRPRRIQLVAADDPRYCPVEAMRRWAALRRGARPGQPVFIAARRDPRGGERLLERRLGAAAIGPMLRRRMAAAGLEPAGYSSHSLRSGMASAAAARGVNLWRLKEHLRHTRPETTGRYVREVDRLHDHPARGLL